MKAELRAKFFDRFVTTGRARIATAQKAVSDGDAATARIELHSLSGEASMLGFDDIGALSRVAEQLAKAWEDGDAKSRVQCGREARKIVRAIEELASSGPGGESESTAAEASKGARATVLVVDDSELAGESLQDALEAVGIASELACNEQRARETCARLANPLVLLDVNMPGVDTGELCKALRALSHGPDVYFVSGLSEDELEDITRRHGASGFIVKSAGGERVAERVLEILGRHTEGSET